MAPSVELYQPEASHMGNIVERMIAYDYLYETRPWPPLLTPSGPPSTVGDFFDKGSLADYKTALKLRHPLEVDRRTLDARNDLKIPDISTWHGEFRERVYGVSSQAKVGNRNEHYEIKPYNTAGTDAGRKKLDNITRNNRDLLLTRVRLLDETYVRGDWYPPEARPGHAKPNARRIRFKQAALAIRALQHKLQRWSAVMKSMGLQVVVMDLWIEVVRHQPGLLQYMICFEIEFDDDASEDFENAFAAKLVRLVYEHLMVGFTDEQRRKEVAYLDTLRPVRSRSNRGRTGAQEHRVAVMNRAADQEARYEIDTVGKIVDEIKPLVEQLRVSLATRSRGLPGDLFLISADETYFRQEIEEVRARSFARNTQMLRQLYGPAVPDIPTTLAITRTAVLTQAQVLKALNAEAKKFVENPEKWLFDHREDIIRGVAFVVLISALAAAVILTAGLAAPAIPVAEGALVGAGTTAAAGTTALAVEGAAVTTVGTGAVGAGSVGVVVDAAGLTQAQLAALRFGIGMRQAQATLAIGSRAAGSAAISDAVLAQGSGASSSALAQLSMNSVLVPMGFSAAQLREIEQSVNSDVLKQWHGALTEGGPAVAALSSHHLVAHGKSPDSVLLGLGRLYLLKLRAANTSNKLPPLQAEFDHASYSDDLRPVPGGREQPPKRLRYLGMVRCK